MSSIYALTRQTPELLASRMYGQACAPTEVLLPSWCLPRRAYGVEVVGATLLAAAQGGTARAVAREARVPVSTLRAWLRAVGRFSLGADRSSVAAATVRGASSRANLAS